VFVSVCCHRPSQGMDIQQHIPQSAQRSLQAQLSVGSWKPNSLGRTVQTSLSLFTTSASCRFRARPQLQQRLVLNFTNFKPFEAQHQHQLSRRTSLTLRLTFAAENSSCLQLPRHR